MFGQELRGVGIPVDEDCQSWVGEALGPCCCHHRPFPKSQWSEDSPSAPTPCSAPAVVGSAMSHPYRLPHHLSSSPLLSTLRGTAGALAGGGLPSCMLLGHSVPIVLSRGRCPGPGERRGGGSGQGLCSPHTTQQPSLGLGLFSHTTSSVTMGKSLPFSQMGLPTHIIQIMQTIILPYIHIIPHINF